jgi:hypothetical protein
MIDRSSDVTFLTNDIPEHEKLYLETLCKVFIQLWLDKKDEVLFLIFINTRPLILLNKETDHQAKREYENTSNDTFRDDVELPPNRCGVSSLKS